MSIKTLAVVIPNFGDTRISNILKYFVGENQDLLNRTEIIIVDGNLDNPCKNIYQNYSSIISQAIVEKDNGIFDALNKGISISNSDYILLMGADDNFSSPGFLKLFFENLDSSSIYGIDCQFINEKEKIVRYWKNKNISKKNLKKGIYPPHFSLVISSEIYKKIGPFKTKLGNLGLDSIWLDCLLDVNFNYKYLGNKICTNMSLGGASTGSIAGIIEGNKILFNYLVKKRGFFNAVYSIINKLFSKLLQLIFIKNSK